MSGSSCTVKHSFPKIQTWSISDTWKPILLHCILGKNYNINRTWKVKLLYILLTWRPGKENAFIFLPWNISRRAIYFNWFKTHNHIKISWKVQFKCYFTYLPSCLWRLFTTGIQLILGTLILPLKYIFPLADGESHIGLPSFLRH